MCHFFLKNEMDLLLIDTVQISTFGQALLYIIGGSLFVLLGLGVAKLLGPDRPNPEKLSSYECGEDTIGDSTLQFNMRFYVIALIFLIFEVEILFLFPWSTVFAKVEWIQAFPQWGIVAAVEMVLFMLILIAGLIYAWVHGDLDWIKPQPLTPQSPQALSEDLYQQINEKYAGTKAPEKAATAPV
ncbi:MAG: NADH-quinone oxidoreductase subunit A [Bacteroidota bacterium]